nr:reverse transcriptase domain-containing protein [Tanacetum cinerariifolium]
MDIKDKLDLDQIGTPVDATKYHSLIGTLMYLTSSRPDIVHTTCVCARYQAYPTEKHLKEVKRIFRYLWGTVNMGLWYSKDSGFELIGFSYADYAGCKDTFKSTSGRNQRHLPKDTPIDRLEVLRYDTGKRSKVRMGIMSTETDLTLKQSQQEHQSDIFVIFTVTMEILLEPTSNKLLVVTHRLIFKSIFYSINEIVTHWFTYTVLSALRRFGLRTVDAVVKTCQGDSSEFYLITVEPKLRTIVEVAPMADNQTMEELLQAPTKGENASKTDDRIDKLVDQISTLVDIFAKKVVTPAAVKAKSIECLCGNGHLQSSGPQNRASNHMAPPSFAPVQIVKIASTSGTLLSNNIPNSKGEMKAITTRSGVAYEGPSIPTNPSPKKVVEQETKEITDKEQSNFQGSTAHIQPPLHKKATNQMEKFFQIFQDLHFDISFADALLLMPKFASTIKSLLANKDKLFELAKIPFNDNCSAMLLKKLPKKLGDLDKFLIPCDFPGMDVGHALADLGASINLMPLSIWKKLFLPELTPTRMTLELADRSITRPKGVAEDVFVKVGKFHFPTDFVVVDFEADHRVPLILGRSFLRTGHSLIDVYGEEITLWVNDKVVTFNLNHTTRYSSTYYDMSVNQIDVIDVAREEYAQEMLRFSKNSSGDNPNSTSKTIISDSSPSLTLSEGSDFILEEIEAYLKDESISTEIYHADCDPKGDICLKIVKWGPISTPSDEPKARRKGTNKLPVIIAKDLKYDEKEALLKVLKSHKRAIAWKITDIKGIDPHFCTHKILMEKDYKPTVQSQRRVNQKIHEVIKKEVIKLLDEGMIYLISDKPWVSPIHCVPKKGGITVVENEKNELIPIRLVTGWRVCIDYQKLNDVTRRDHFPFPFMDHMLERLVRNDFYCFLDGFSGYFQIPINPPDQEKTTFTCPYGTFAYQRMPFDFCNAPRTFQRPMTYLLEKETPFLFSKYCIDAFETLKKNLTEAPILVVPDWNLPFELMCDASDFAIGAVLGQ